MGTVADKLNLLLNTKNAIRGAINAKGQSIDDADPFSGYPAKIAAIRHATVGTMTLSQAGPITIPHPGGQPMNIIAFFSDPGAIAALTRDTSASAALVGSKIVCATVDVKSNVVVAYGIQAPYGSTDSTFCRVSGAATFQAQGRQTVISRVTTKTRLSFAAGEWTYVYF